MNMLADCDDGPTKQYLIDHRDDPELKLYYDLSFAKRGAEELYDMLKDPDQLNNLANNPEYAKTKADLAAKLMTKLKATGDPRATRSSENFDEYPYGEDFDKYPYRAPYQLNTK
jgi:hypothetical protein